MGTKASKESSTARSDPFAGLHYAVRAASGVPGESDSRRKLTMKLNAESLVLDDSMTGERVASWPYFRILCWGHTSSTFQFKVMPAMAGPSASLAADTAPGTAASTTRSSEMAVVVFETTRGTEIEHDIMKVVRVLMSRMDAQAVSDTEMACILSMLAADPDAALHSVKQLAATKAFTLRQAAQLVDSFDTVSPFDKIEAGVALFSGLLSEDSFPLLLASFPDHDDQANLCHRLGMELDSSGTLKKIGSHK